MNETKINYDEDADVLYVSFGRSEHVTGIEVPLANLRQLSEELWQAVLYVITMPPVSHFLSTNLSFFPKTPPLPELLAA